MEKNKDQGRNKTPSRLSLFACSQSLHNWEKEEGFEWAGRKNNEVTKRYKMLNPKGWFRGNGSPGGWGSASPQAFQKKGFSLSARSPSHHSSSSSSRSADTEVKGLTVGESEPGTEAVGPLGSASL